MCPACEKSKEIFGKELTKLCQSGVDYVQAMDQNHGGGSYFCYRDKHGHVPAPGKWQAEETLALLKRIDRGQVLLGCESASADPFLSELQFSDNRFELCYYIGLPVPLYSYIYHEYVNNFMGNQICMMLSYEEYNYPYRVAHSFVCGDMLTAVIDDKQNIGYAWGGSCFKIHTDKGHAYAMLKNLNAWRQKGGKSFLHLGRMVKPLPLHTVGKNSFVLEDKSTLYVEKVLTSAFEYEGDVAQFAVNYNAAPITVTTEQSVDVYKNADMTDVDRGVCEFVIPAHSAVMLKK